MTMHARGVGRTLGVAGRTMLLLTLALGLAYPLALTAIGQLALPLQANGSLLTDRDGEPVGSALIGQTFVDEHGEALAGYFQARPSAAGEGYDSGASSGSNQGPENQELIATITERKRQVAEFNGVAAEHVPADAVTASSSGLDPHISPEYAALQIERVASARSIPVAEVRALVDAHTRGPDLGYLGESRVNVLQLNLALDARED